MAFPFRSGSTAAPHELGDDDAGLHADWRERMITVIGVSVGVAIVALIAVLMGMA